MVNPCPGYPVTTAYGVKGNSWGCGWHDGEDRAAPRGSKVVAAWGGVVVEAAYPTSFGSAFGRAVVIDHDKLPDGSPGYWGLYAHLDSESVSVGQRVEAGQQIGTVDSTGNSSGHHLHFGIYKQPSWCSGCGINPQPWINAGGGSSGGGSKTVYLSKLHYGQQDSDSVKWLQEALNGISIPGGQTLPITGNYLTETDEEVRLHQRAFIPPEDPPLESFVGPEQADLIFGGKGYNVINDLD